MPPRSESLGGAGQRMPHATLASKKFHRKLRRRGELQRRASQLPPSDLQIHESNPSKRPSHVAVSNPIGPRLCGIFHGLLLVPRYHYYCVTPCCVISNIIIPMEVLKARSSQVGGGTAAAVTMQMTSCSRNLHQERERSRRRRSCAIVHMIHDIFPRSD